MGEYGIGMLNGSRTYSAQGLPELNGMVVTGSDEDDSTLVVLRHGHGAKVAGGIVFRSPIVGVSRWPSGHRGRAV